MRNTSMINAKPPVISRVCRESRRVAFQTGALLEHSWDNEQPQLYHRIEKHWVDLARDRVVHLHFNTRTYAWYPRSQWKEDNGNPFEILRDAMLPTNGIRSITQSLLSIMKTKEGRDVVELMSEILICLQVVVLHTHEEPAIQSGLFGRMGEERIVMVDPFDDKRVGEFRDFWRRHQRTQDELTQSFFEGCMASDPIKCRRATLKAMEDAKTRWLLERWFDTTGPWVREQQNRFATMRWVRRIRNVPGLVQEEVWEKAPRVLNTRHSVISHWVPNQQHPWVRDTYSSMPRFIPAVMFRLCTNTCRRQKEY